MRTPPPRSSSGQAVTVVAWVILGVLGLVGVACAPQIVPQIGVERIGAPYPPFPKGAPVKVYFRGEPSSSYREVGKVTATCPVKHWVGGQQQKGRPICVDGLRQGARKLGAHAVVEIKGKRIRPPGSPDTPWIIMSGVAVRLAR